MGLRARIAAWLHAPAPTPAVGGSPLATYVQELRADVDQLKLERPAFLAELEAIYERCHDILDNAESKRARVSAAQSKLDKRREQRGAEEAEADPNDREAVKAQVRHRLIALGKLH